ncbi:MAG: hypothetical protein R3F53_28960 [Gammaproteobacteria bacterium]
MFVTIGCVDDPPVAVDDTASVTEDDPATTLTYLLMTPTSMAARPGVPALPSRPTGRW